tara:strand:- start:8600 stop:9625 length:1026 start_codon:yes stop_codon:yes gene_type:complete
MESLKTGWFMHSCRLFIAIAFAFFVTSCEKKEIPIVLEQEDDQEIVDSTEYEIHEVEFAMGESYDTQLWYDLESNAIVKTGSRFAWDIAFDCAKDEHWISLNASVGMLAANSGATNFNTVSSDAGLNFRADHPWGLNDSLCLGEWWKTSTVWVIDLGYNSDGTSRGKRKVQFSLLSDGNLEVHWANLNGNNEQTATIKKDGVYNRLGLSFKEGTQVNFEPMKTEYDLVFTRYQNIFYAPYQPYLVVGVLLNPYQTTAVEEWSVDFDDIDTLQAKSYNFTDIADIIGYDWKFFSLEDNFFTVFPDKNFLVRDQKGLTFKLRFLDFYDMNGVKGYPLMEVQRL